MTATYDAIVVGLGAMGSATASSLARRGLRVLGLDRYRPPHRFGSSHGGSRIIREAYFEHPMYVPLIQRTYREWQALEERSGETLWMRTGGLMIGPRDGRLVSGALATVAAHALSHEELDAEALRRRFPAFRPDDAVVGVWEPRAGILFPESCVEAQLREARAAGAELRFEEPVRSWRTTAQGVEVTTFEGAIGAASLVFTAGAWIGELVGDPGVKLEVERTVQHWFSTRPGREPLTAERLPIFLWEFEPERIFYGFPDVGRGIKIALHYQGERTTSADSVRREVAGREITRIRQLMECYLPAANGPHVRSEVCMYTNSPDLHFVIDTHPDHDRVWVVSACSGHGFKFAPVIGEAVADQVVGAEVDLDLSPFGLDRFLGG